MNMTTLTRRILGYRWLQVLLVVLVIYSAAGFLLVPALIKSQLPRRLAPLLHREVAVARVRANPFALSVTLDGFRVKDKDGSPWFGWERLYVNMSAQTLFRFAPVFKEIRLEGFQARIVLDKKGDPTFADLLVPGPAPAKPAGNPPELRIQRLLVVAARVDFLDQATAQPFATTLGPLNFDLDAFRLSRDSRNPYAFSGRTERGETFGWQGHFYLDPLRSQGTFFVKNLYLPKYAPFYRDAVAFDLQGGTLDFKAGYEFQWGEGDHRFRIHQGEAGLDHVKAAENAKLEPAVDVPELRVAGIEADLLESWARVASLTVRDGRIQAQKDARGLNLQRMAASRKPPEPAGAKPFRFDLDELRVVNQTVRFEDLTQRRPVRLDLDQIALVVKAFSLDPAKRCGLDLDMRWNGQGRIHASGQAAPLKSSGALDLQVDGLTLAPLTGYLDPALNAVIDAGRLGVKGHADFDMPAARFAFKGDARVDGFKAESGSNATFAWDSLRVGGIQAASSPMAVTLASIDWEGPSARYVLAAAAKPGPAAAPAEARPAAGAKPAAPALKAEVGVFRVKRGGLTFLDRTVQPVAALSLDGIEGQVGRLSTDPAARASVDLRAKVDGAAPLKATGTVNLLSKAAYTDLKLTMGGGGMDLSPLSPYAGHYMGYGIEKGKLELDLAYQVKEAQLQGENRIRMDQFTLGAATDSPDAVHVPVKLGLALLRDRHGVIDLDVPVRGDLSQPDFRLGKVIWHAVLNVFAKIATSPFTLIGKAFGGGDADLSLLAFQPGADAIDPQNGKVLETLAKGLFERPGLRLEMEGTADESQDAPALKRAELEASLQKLKGQPLEAGERPKFLRQAFLEAFPKPRDPKEAKATPEPTPEDMEARLLARIEVDAAALKLLARRRVQAARDRLLQAGNVEEERIFIVDGSERAKKEGGSRVFFELK